MLDVSSERNIAWLRYSHKYLQEKVLLLEKKVAEAEAAKKADDDLCKVLTEELVVLKKKFFASAASERLAKKGAKKNKRRKAQSELTLHNKRPFGELPDPCGELESEEVIHRLDDANTEDAKPARCACGQGELCEMTGAFEEAGEVTVTERKYLLKRHRRQKYKCTACSKIVAAKGPEKLKDGGSFSIHMAAQVAADKFHRHLPLNRQTEMMAERGLSVTSRTLYGLTEHLMARLGGDDLLHRILAEIKAEPLVHLDESPMDLMQPKTKGYVWSISNAKGVYYQYETTRSGGVAREMLQGYTGGIVMVDAYSGYDFLEKIEGITLVLCWAHVRRRFFDAMDHYPRAEEVVDLIDKIYALDRKAENLGELLKIRADESQKLVDEIDAWISAQQGRYLESSTVGKAIGYAKGHWSRLTAFLSNAQIPLDNNTGERAQRQPVMGRKNFFGFRTINGADCGMFFYTLISTCKQLTVSPKAYLLEMGLRAARGGAVLTPYQYAEEITSRLSIGEEMSSVFAAMRQ